MNYKRKRGIYPLPHKREDKKMKVNRPENKEYTFEELYPGDCFCLSKYDLYKNKAS
jgi:hypothetical protein